MLVFQSVLAIILGIANIFCYWIASKKEDSFNIEKFGNEKRIYERNIRKRVS